ncbi:MAG: hypothetical protein HRU18_24775 [Pseudoalteromonas sp.]|uniref:hypothetical protein n=1 Tax=Pseudoalteromonas sp. TaxID=53249 RepID=UPI001DB2CAC2|nr:hypothetical protein [Pseudoalteromonas sp.]NRA81424.1 hypothetical protein [Pseudoalteromonas sp.]
MFIDFLLKAAEIALDILSVPLSEDSYEGEYDIYEPSSKSLYTNADGSTEILTGSSMGTRMSDLSGD